MFNTEEDLQYWLADRLRAAGYQPQMEVVTHDRHNTRADIVCGDTVIECKKTLDRDAMHQAVSQATMYASHLGLSKKIVVGMPPSSAAAQKSAESAAVAIMSVDPNLSVYWVNQAGVVPVGQHRASVLDAIETPAYHPAPIPVSIPTVTQPIAIPVPAVAVSAIQRPGQQSTPSWKLAAAVAYIAMGAWFMGGVGAVIGAIGGLVLIQWR